MPLTPSVLAVTAQAGDFAKLVADLQGSGLQVRRSEDLLDAILSHINTHSDVMVCDVDSMQWEEVLQTLQRLRPSVPVILLTRRGDERLWLQMMNAGAFDVLEKSYQRFQLQWAVVNALGDTSPLSASAGM